MKKVLDYKEQGVRTKAREGTYANFPRSPKEISKIIHGLLIHPATFKLHNITFSKERIDDRNKDLIQKSIDKLMKLEKKPLTQHRHPENRVVNICRQFSMFMASVLREQGIPARCRCGFATYFSNGWFEDHWICEYWNEKEKRWVRVDAQIDDIQIQHHRINLDKITLYDLPKEAFFPAGVLWRLYRQGLVSGDLCGFSMEEGKAGAWYIRGNMLRDFFALNKVEYAYNETNKLMEKNYQPNQKELELLDKIAELTINVDKNFDDFIQFSKEHKALFPK